MQRLLVFGLLILGCSVVSAQEFIDVNAYPLGFGDTEVNVEFADLVIPTSDGGYLLIGSYEYSLDPFDYDGRVVKVDADGDAVLGQFVYNFMNEDDRLYGGVELNGFYYFVGERTEDGINYPFIIRTDTNLENQIFAFISSLSYGKALTVEKTYDDKIVIGGYIAELTVGGGGGTIGFYKVIEADLSTGDANMFIGNKIGKITQSADGNYYMFGTVYDVNDDCEDVNVNENVSSTGVNSIPVSVTRGDILVAKYDSDFFSAWPQNRIIGGDTPDGFIDGIATSDGGFALIGQTTCLGVFGDQLGPNDVARSVDDMLLPYWFYRGTPAGTLQWLRSLNFAAVLDYSNVPFGLINSCTQEEFILGYQQNGLGGAGVGLERLSQLEQVYINGSLDDAPGNYHYGRSIATGNNREIVVAGASFEFGGGGDDFAFFRFSPEPQCGNCVCVEDDPFLPAAYQCDNFDSYNLGNITTQSSNWRRWPATSGDGQVEALGAPDNQVLRIANDSPTPDIVYDLNGSGGPDVTSGRHRVSWEMFIEPGSGGYYNFQYEKDELGTNGNWAFELFFDPDGTGRLIVGGSERETFTYPPGEVFEVAHIVDLEQDEMEFWLDHDYKFTMQYDEEADANGLTPGIGAINFYADPGEVYNYWIDNICIRTTGTTPACDDGGVILTVFEGEVCTENGQNYLSACDAGNNGLYAVEEYGECLSICEFNAEFIGRDDLEGIDGSLSPSDLAPSELYAVSCVQDDFPGAYPLYADIYVLNNDTGEDIGVTPPPGAQAYIFDCFADGGQNCVSGSFDVGFYYIVIVSDQITPTYTIQVVPNSICEVSAGTSLLTCGDSATGDLDGVPNLLDALGSNAAYTDCYSGLRTYAGGEIIYQLEIEEASVVDIAFTAEQGQGGLFLFNANCGSGCINYIELPSGGGADTLRDLTLSVGNYYLVVDQESDIGNYELNIDCEYDENNGGFGGIFITTATPPPPPPGCDLSLETHEVNVQISDPASFTAGEDFFFFNSAQGSGQPAFYNSAIAQAYNGAASLVFNIPENQGTERCSFITGDSLQLYIVKDNGNTETAIPQRMTFAPEGVDGVQDGSLYISEGISAITDFSDVAGTAYIQVPTSILFPRGGNIDTSLWLLGDAWTAQTLQSWIEMDVLSPENDAEPLDTISSEGNAAVEIRVGPNQSYTTRFGSINVQTVDSLVSQTIQIIQPGRCALPILNTPTQEHSICAGESITLFVDAEPAPIYTYRWSDGAENSPFNTVSPATTTTYTVTVTQATSAYCTAENTLTFTVNVEPQVPTPVSTGNELICTAGESTTLGVNVNNALYSVDWYAAPSGGGALVTDSPTYTTSVPGTYYAQARNRSNTACVSERIPVTLTLNPPINLTTEQQTVTLCTDSEVTLNVELSGGSGSFEYAWRNAANQLLSTQASYTYDPVTAGVATIELTVTDANDCFATQEFVLTAIAPPTISNYNDPDENNCSDDLLTYSITLTTDGTVETPAFGTLDDLGGNAYAITGIPAGQDLELTITNAACTVPLFVAAPNCDCEANIAAPLSAGDVRVCDPADVIPLAVTLDDSEGYTVNWYNATGGLVLADNLMLSTTELGTYFARTVSETAAQCVSASDTPVILEIRPEITITGEPAQRYVCPGTSFELEPTIMGGVSPYTYRWLQGGTVVAQTPSYGEVVTTTDPITIELEVTDADEICLAATTYVIDVVEQPDMALESDVLCSSDLLTYAFNISSDTDDLSLSVPEAMLEDNGGGNYTVIGVPIDSNIMVIGTNTIAGVGCETTLAITAPDCECEAGIEPPISEGDIIVCADVDEFPPLVVDLEDPEAYTVDWYNAAGERVAENTLTFSTEEAGTYSAEAVNVDAMQCVSSTRTPVTLEIVPELVIDSAPTVMTICQGTSFLLEPEVTGGLTPYTYTWRQNDTEVGTGPSYGVTVADLVPIVLELTVEGAQGVCVAMETYVVSVIAPPSVNQVPGITCSEDLLTYGFNIISTTDDLDLSVTGATLMSNGGNSYTVSNVPITDNITITGINTAGTLECASELTIPAPEDCNCAAQAIPPAEPVSMIYTICANDSIPDFEIMAPADNFIVEWYNDPADEMPFLTGELTYEPEGAETVYVRLRDETNNCTSTEFVAVSLVINAAPAALAGANVEACTGTMVQLDATASSGTGELTYVWSEELPIDDPTSALPLVTVTEDATLALTVMDENGCTSTDIIQLTALDNPELEMTVTAEILCFGNPTGEIEAQVISGTLPYSYLWSTGAVDVATLSGLTAGEYILTVTDDNGCTVENLLLLTEPPMLTLTVDSIAPVINDGGVLFPGVMDALISGGTPPYSVDWLNEDGVSVSDSLTLVTFEAGEYQLLVQDANGCDILATGIEVNLIVGTVPVVEDRQQVAAFPNPTEGNLRIVFSQAVLEQIDLRVYDILGRSLFRTAFDGNGGRHFDLDLATLPAGTYWIRIKIADGYYQLKIVKT